MARTLGDIAQELKDGIIEPAKAEAEKILAEARSQAESIKNEARRQAEETLAQAERKAQETMKQMEADLEVAARNFLLMVQERLEASVVLPVLDEEIARVASEPELMARIMEQVLVAYAKTAGEEARLELLLSEKQQKELEAWCLDKFTQKMMGHVDVHFTSKINFGFKLGVQGHGPQFNFSDGLAEAFATFCSPRFRKHFFGSREG